MNDKSKAGASPAKSAVSKVKDAAAFTEREALAVEAAIKRAVAGVEAWYEKHFHRATVRGAQPISADDKALLIKHVEAAAKPTTEE